VLGLIAFGERSGYDLARLAENSVAHLWTPSQSQIYKTLPRLVASATRSSATKRSATGRATLQHGISRARDARLDRRDRRRNRIRRGRERPNSGDQQLVVHSTNLDWSASRDASAGVPRGCATLGDEAGFTAASARGLRP